MTTASTRQKAIKAAGTILIRQGFQWVNLDEVASVAAVDPQELESEFPNRALLCEAWMEENDAKAIQHHKTLLKSEQPRRKVLDQYFGELEDYMVHHEFGGCPYTNTARALIKEPSTSLSERIREHKAEVRSFFQRLCKSASYQPEIIAEALFLIYSGATTEAANLRGLVPVKAGRQAALSLFDMYSKA